MYSSCLTQSKMKVILGFFICSLISLMQCTIVINMGKDQPLNYTGFKNAIERAKQIFARNATEIVSIKIPLGIHVLESAPGAPVAIYLHNITPGPRGRLIIEGSGMNKTILLINDHTTFFNGRNVSHFTLRGLTMKRDRPMAGQGTVIETGKGYVTLNMHKGFPGMDVLMDKKNKRGRYLRRYTYTNDTCTIQDTKVNQQIHYRGYKHLGARKWKIILGYKRRALYSPGDVIGVKAKCCSPGNNVYFFHTGDDIVFENIKFIRASRGAIRGGVNNIRFSNISIPKDAANWCLSTSGGGPQLGNANEDPIKNVVVENLFAEATGDDSIGLFNVASGMVRNCVIKDSFARGILLYKSRGVILENNKLTRCVVLHKDL